MKRAFCGFSPIQVLVVVSIIAASAGILMPALGMVKDAVHGAKCQSNQRHIGPQWR